jgi:hypothetical protein
LEKPVSPEPATPNPLPLKPSPPIPFTALPEEFGVPLPMRRLDWRFLQGKGFFLTMVVVLPIVLLFASWFCLLHYPRFHAYADPTHQYSVMFPTKPIWTGGSAGGGSDGEATRNIMWSSETYRIQVAKYQSWRLMRMKNLNSGTLAQTIMSSENPAVVRPRPDILIANAAAEYEQWMTVKLVVVGRVFVVNEFIYEMTISGRDLSLDDSRVQRFFDSFQLAMP